MSSCYFHKQLDVTSFWPNLTNRRCSPTFPLDVVEAFSCTKSSRTYVLVELHRSFPFSSFPHSIMNR
jgi:hypothetical protein